MKRRLFACLLLVSLGQLALATPPGILRLDVRAPMAEAYPAVYAALEQARFWVVFEADLGANMAGFADRWGENLNRNRLDGIRSMVVCNVWHANQVGNADPDLLALCPQRVTLVERDGATRILFARPTVVAAGSPGIGAVEAFEEAVVQALRAAVTAIEGGAGDGR